MADKPVKHLLELKFNLDTLRKESDYDVGHQARNILTKLQKHKDRHAANNTLCLDFNKFFETSANHLLKKLLLSNVLLRNVACFSPLLRQVDRSTHMTAAVVANLPCCNTPELADKVLSEWKLCQQEDISDDFYVNEQGHLDDGSVFVKYRPTDDYWYRIMQIVDSKGQPKFPSICTVARAALTLSNGQADVERGFCINDYAG
jgi:hypothetical protein